MFFIVFFIGRFEVVEISHVFFNLLLLFDIFFDVSVFTEGFHDLQKRFVFIFCFFKSISHDFFLVRDTHCFIWQHLSHGWAQLVTIQLKIIHIPTGRPCMLTTLFFLTWSLEIVKLKILYWCFLFLLWLNLLLLLFFGWFVLVVVIWRFTVVIMIMVLYWF